MRRCGLTDRLSRLAGKGPGRQFRLGFALAKVKDDRSFIPLSRLVRWASNNGIEPEDIDDAALGRYRKELKLRLPETGGEDPPDHLQPLAAPALPRPGPLWHPKRQRYFGGATIFFAFAMASPYISGPMIGVKMGSPPVNQVRTYISSAICAGVSRFTTM
jgi:hypothetical protein